MWNDIYFYIFLLVIYEYFSKYEISKSCFENFDFKYFSWRTWKRKIIDEIFLVGMCTKISNLNDLGVTSVDTFPCLTLTVCLNFCFQGRRQFCPLGVIPCVVFCHFENCK